MTMLHNQRVTPLERAADAVVGPRITSLSIPWLYDLNAPVVARRYGHIADFPSDVNALAAVGNTLYAFTLETAVGGRTGNEVNIRAVNLLTDPLSFGETTPVPGIANAVRAATVGPDGAYYIATDTRVQKIAVVASGGVSRQNLAAVPGSGIDSIVTVGPNMFAFSRRQAKIYDLGTDGSTSNERDYPSHVDADQAGKAAFVYNYLVYHAGNDGIIWRISDIYNDPISTEKYVTTLPITDNPQGAAVTADGSAYMVLGNRKLYRINPRTGQVDSEYTDEISSAYAYIAAGLHAFTYPIGLGREADRVSAIRNAHRLNALRGTRGGLDLLAVQTGMSYTHTFTARTAQANPKVNFTLTYPPIATLPAAQRAAWLVWIKVVLSRMLPPWYDLGIVNASA